MSSRQYYDSGGDPCSLDRLCENEPAWAASRIRVMDEQLSAATARASELERELTEANEIISTQADKLNDSGQESLRNSTESMHTTLLLLELAKEMETLYSASQQEASMLDNLRLCALNRVKRIDALRAKTGLIAPDGKGETNG